MELIRLTSLKIRQYGDRGYDISLPRAWVDDNGMKPGDVLDVSVDPTTRNLIIAKRENGEPQVPDAEAEKELSEK